MKAIELMNELSLVPPNYDMMVKVGDSERDLITKISDIHCINPKLEEPVGFVELETVNKIDWYTRKPFCPNCGITESQPMYMQKYCRYCGHKLESEDENPYVRCFIR